MAKKYLSAWTIVLAAVCFSAAGDTRADTYEMFNGTAIRVMSFNIRTLVMEQDFRDNWGFRKKQVAALILRHDPDLVGMQEVYTSQAKGLAKALPEYDWFGLPRDDGKKLGERCPIFYKRARFELLDHGTFWLSETPDVKGSVSWNSACRRIVTWGKFRDKQSDEVFFHFNTHFDHMSKLAREMSAELILKRIDSIAGKAGAVVTGDFNTTDDTAPYQTMTSSLDDARLVSSTTPKGPEATSRDFTPGSPPKKRIDYIFVSKGARVMDYAVLDDTYNKDRRPSDHMPVIGTVSFN